MDKKEINYKKMPVPTSPGSQQITCNGLQSEKGGASFVSTMPTKNIVPDGKPLRNENCSDKKNMS